MTPQKEKSIELYRELGLHSSHAAKIAAAKAAIVMTFATDWNSPKIASWMDTASAYLEAFCGDQVYFQAIQELNFGDFEESKLSGEVGKKIMDDLKTVFPFAESPNSRSYWVEAIRHTKLSLL